ncbi:sodium:solute symporter family protein [Zhenpiania hominis]|uniref:sodium:solute symporter family protein n=1 Tax=Zhenpiania hominis TaxID=2763644 RepID=UPI0039F47120
MIDFKELWGAPDWIVLVLYFIGVMSVGFIMHRKASKNFKSFFVASRRLTIPVLIGVAAAGWYDSWTIVGLGELGSTVGISIVLFYVIPSGILRLPLALWIGPITRDKIPDYVVTLPDLIRYFYNKTAGVLASIVPMASILYCCALLFAVGEVLNLVSGAPIWLTMIISGFAIILYTAMAGMWGLAVTDLIQFMVMTVSAGAVLLGIYHEFNGIDALYSAVMASDPEKLSLTGNLTAAEAFGHVIAAAALYVNAQSYQRFGAAKSGGDIKVAYSLMLVIGVGFSAVMVITGLASSVLHPDAATASEGFWATVFEVLPPGARGLFVAALIAAVMSTVSADMLITGGILVKDIYKDLFRPSLSDQGVLKGTRVMIVVIGIFIIAGTYLWRNGIGSAWSVIGGFQVAVFLIPILGGFFFKKKTAKGGLIAIVTGILFYAVWQFALGIPFGVPSSVATWIFGGIVYFIACFATYKEKDNRLTE